MKCSSSISIVFDEKWWWTRRQDKTTRRREILLLLLFPTRGSINLFYLLILSFFQFSTLSHSVRFESGHFFSSFLLFLLFLLSCWMKKNRKNLFGIDSFIFLLPFYPISRLNLHFDVLQRPTDQTLHSLLRCPSTSFAFFFDFSVARSTAVAAMATAATAAAMSIDRVMSSATLFFFCSSVQSFVRSLFFFVLFCFYSIRLLVSIPEATNKRKSTFTSSFLTF